jgi:Fe-S cluster assembly protein SufD
MKEPILFKDGQHPPALRPVETKSAGAHESSFFFHEITLGNQMHEFKFHANVGSVLEVVLFQNVPLNEDVQIKVMASTEKDSAIKLTVIQNGGARSLVDLHSETLGSNSKCEVRGLQNAKGSQKLYFNARGVHSIPHTSSDLQVWSAVQDESRSVFNGLIQIEQGASHTEAYQKNKNLILSDRATVDSFPKLLIANDQVKCAHGSSTSTLQPDQAAYLQSRGIDQGQAELMLVQGFLRQAISWISNEECRKSIEKSLNLEDEEWL